MCSPGSPAHREPRTPQPFSALTLCAPGQSQSQPGLKMPLFSRKKKPSEEARKRLEYQMCLVRVISVLIVWSWLPNVPGRLRVDIGTFFPFKSTVRHCSRLPRTGVGSPSLEVTQRCADVALGDTDQWCLSRFITVSSCIGWA